jgi:signal transduction histidine kinase
MGLEDPGVRFWGRAGRVAPCVVLFALGVSVLSARGFTDIPALYAALHLCWCFATLLTSVGLYLRWRLTGEAAIGLLSVAAAVVSVPQLPLAVAEVAWGSNELALATDPLIQLAVALPAALLATRCVRSAPVDSSLRPARLAVLYGGGAFVAVVAVTVSAMQGWLSPVADSVAITVDLGFAAIGFTLAPLFVTRAQSIRRPLTTRLAVVLVGLGLGGVVGVLARTWWAPLWVLSGLICLAAVVVLGLLALSLMQTVLDFHSLRLLALTMRVSTAEETVRREQERIHELRATVAGIRSASGTLRRYQEIDAARKHAIEQMMTDELARLERLLGAEEDLATMGKVALDGVIRPLVVRHREHGLTVHWRPSGAFALANPDEVAEVLNVLLTNTGRHAPGSPAAVTVDDLGSNVRITVSDVGPGVSPEVAERLFDRGARGSLSPGQGLGLHIAQRLAANQGGTLALIDSPAGGARFALTLRSASTAEDHVPGRPGVPQPRQDVQ